MKHITRRDFIKGSVAAGIGLAMVSPFSRVRGANDDIRVAVVGINGRAARTSAHSAICKVCA